MNTSQCLTPIFTMGGHYRDFLFAFVHSIFPSEIESTLNVKNLLVR